MEIPQRSAVTTVRYIAVASVLFAAGFVASQRSRVELRLRTVPTWDPASSYVPRYRSETGEQLVMIYFGAAACPGSNQPALPRAVEALKMRLAGLAEQEAMSFVSIGVALDWSPEKGIEHLSKFGHFDEVAAGYNWGNSLALRYMWSEKRVATATPQVVVYKRFFTVPVDSGGPTRYGESNLEFVAGATGLPAILAWAHSGRMWPDSNDALGSKPDERGPVEGAKQRVLHVP